LPFLPICLRASFPSLRVLIINQERNNTIKVINDVNEINVGLSISILFKEYNALSLQQ
tara:strand:+ start:204 stop:377 length:174 start_codon:yes stop_codon:yes gene_type:complete